MHSNVRIGELIVQEQVQEAVAAAAREFFGPETLADYLDVPVRTVYSWNHSGTGPRPIRVGKHVRYRRADVEAWLEAQAQPRRAG